MPEKPPAFQWYPRDFAAAMHQVGASDAHELAYRRALDASWDSGSYGVGTPEEWLAWGRVAPADAESFLRFLATQTATLEPCLSLAQVRMARDRMEQVLRSRKHATAGSKGGRKSRGGNQRKPRLSDAEARPSTASASASASDTESKAEAGRDVDPQLALPATATPATAEPPPPVAPARTPRRRPAAPVLELSDADIAHAVAVTGCSPAVAIFNAEQIRLSGPQRGYTNYAAALLNWCRRDVEKGTQAPPPQRQAPTDGEQRHGPRGEPIVWWQGSWRAPDEAQHFGWKPRGRHPA